MNRRTSCCMPVLALGLVGGVAFAQTTAPDSAVPPAPESKSAEEHSTAPDPIHISATGQSIPIATWTVDESQPDGPDESNPDEGEPGLRGAPPAIAFQALLTDDRGDPLPGPTANLAFTIHDSGGAVIEGPISLLGVPLSNGVVDAQIPVHSSSFDGGDREIGVSVNGTNLTPRIPVARVPYAMRVDRVASAELDDAIDLGTTSASGTLRVYRTTANTPAIELLGSASRISTYGSDGLEQIRLYGVSYGELWLNDFTGNDRTVWLSATSNSGGQFTLSNATGTSTVSANGGLGSLSLTDSLTVADAIGGTVRARMARTGSAGLFQAANASGAVTVSVTGDEGDAGALVSLSSGTLTTLELDARGTNASGEVVALSSGGRETAKFQGREETFGSGGGLVLYNDNPTTNQRTVVLDGGLGGTNNGGGILLYDVGGAETVRIDGDDAGAGQILMRDLGTTTLALNADSTTDSGGEIIVYGGAGNVGVQIVGDYLDPEFGARDAEIRLFNDSGAKTIDLGGGSHGTLALNNDIGTKIHLAASGLAAAGQIALYDTDNTQTVMIQAAESTVQGAQILLRKADGTTTIELDADYSGDGRIITNELQITGGSDLSEQFDIQAPDGKVEPGMVVCIDPRTAGGLRVSDKPYDRLAAGVISGAGGVKPGMLMGQKGTAADGAHPVALTGRVYCRADASGGPIEPGDLLTTSNRPGHAMKVRDHMKAQGAIIGKAMTGLAEGQGLILVLVQAQ